MIYNPVVLIRKKIVVTLEFDNQTYLPEQLIGYTVHHDLKYYQPKLDISQFWTTESNYTLPRKVYNKETIDIEIDFEILPKKAYYQREVLKLFLAPELSLFFNHLTADQIKTWLGSKMFFEIGVSALIILIHALLKVYVIREGKLRS